MGSSTKKLSENTICLNLLLHIFADIFDNVDRFRLLLNGHSDLGLQVCQKASKALHQMTNADEFCCVAF